MCVLILFRANSSPARSTSTESSLCCPCVPGCGAICDTVEENFTPEALSCFHSPFNAGSEDWTQVLVLATEPLTLTCSQSSLGLCALSVPGSFPSSLSGSTPISFRSYHPTNPHLSKIFSNHNSVFLSYYYDLKILLNALAAFGLAELHFLSQVFHWAS